MKFEAVDQKKNPLLKREEVMLTVNHEGKPTPSRTDLLEPLAKELKSNKDLILIDKIFSVKGSQASRIKAFVFDRKEDMPKEKLEIIKKRMEKSKEKAEKKEGEAPQEAGGKPEPAKEGKKEEPRPEEKPVGEEKKKPESEEKKGE